jgi:fused signal recognition particle receptor
MIPENNFDIEEDNLNILFVFGVNGVGKTTSIAKLAHKFKSQGLDLLVAAADTYRAAAVDQLDIWCDRVGVHLVKHEGKSKPSAVIYDAIDSALARKKQVLIVDTAGRFHNRENLLEELKKLNKILNEKAPHAKRYNLLVVDATTGQNAVEQADRFNESVGINGVFLSKMDSTAKGGIALTMAHQHNIPVVFIGTGEKLENVEYFKKHIFVKSIFE